MVHPSAAFIGRRNAESDSRWLKNHPLPSSLRSRPPSWLPFRRGSQLELTGAMFNVKRATILDGT
jgi:hypothetical protein